MKIKLVELKELPNNFKVYLNNKFRKKLFQEAVKKSGGFLKFSREVNFDHSTLTKIRRGYRLVKGQKRTTLLRVQLLKRILKVAKMSLNETEKHIEAVASNKVISYLKFPLKSSDELALIFGHAIGDGHVSNERFKYTNQRLELVNEVKNTTEKIFGCKGYYFYVKEKRSHGIEFAGIVSKLLGMVGTPLGRKTMKKFYVPSWIMNGTINQKMLFLRALFDDDGSVVFSQKGPFISFSQYKNKKFLRSHKKYLAQITLLLKDLHVNTTKISYQKDYKETEEWGFRIKNFENLLNFSKNVNSTNLLKHQRLNTIIRNNY